MSRVMQLGKMAYNAYCTIMKTAPAWEDLSLDEQRAWTEAACCIRADAMNDAAWSSLGPL